MRLRDASLTTATVFALALLAGCHNLRNQSPYFYSTQQDVPKFKSDSSTPKAISDNEVALAQEYIKMGKYDLALDSLKKATKADPSSPDAYTVLGLLYEQINRPELAEANYAKAVKLAPNKGDMLNNYGAWLCRSGHMQQADAQFRKALADPFYKTPQAAMGNAAVCALKANQPEVAEGWVRQILATDPTNAEALQLMVTISYQRHDYMGTRGFVERFLATGRSAPLVLDLGARAEDKLGDAAAASAYRTRLSTDFPQYTPGHD